jgi:hypothetical protein
MKTGIADAYKPKSKNNKTNRAPQWMSKYEARLWKAGYDYGKTQAA